MVVIFGIGSGGTQDLGEVAPVVCPNCHNDVLLHHVRSTKTFSLYFAPIAQYGANDYLVCPICTRGLRLEDRHRPAVDQMAAATGMFRHGRLPVVTYQGQVARFWRALGVDPTGTQVLHPPASVPPPHPPPVPAPSAPSLAARLADLGRLRAEGVLTDDEFAAAKRRVLED